MNCWSPPLEIPAAARAFSVLCLTECVSFLYDEVAWTCRREKARRMIYPVEERAPDEGMAGIDWEALLDQIEILGLTLSEPWASLVRYLEKLNETRSFRRHFRGWLAIHSADNFSNGGRAKCELEPFKSALTRHGITSIKDFPFGHIIALARLEDCIRIGEDGFPGLSAKEEAFGIYTPGRWVWKLADQIALDEPIPCKGHRLLWRLSPNIRRRLAEVILQSGWRPTPQMIETEERRQLSFLDAR